MQQQENYKIRENFKVCSVRQQEVKPLKPTNIRELNTVDKINDWDKRNQRSLSTQNTDAGSISTNVKDYNLNKVPLNKRYDHRLSEQSASQPSPKSSSRTKTLSNDSSEDSFHSAALSFTQEMSRLTIQTVRQQESLWVFLNTFLTRTTVRKILLLNGCRFFLLQVFHWITTTTIHEIYEWYSVTLYKFNCWREFYDWYKGQSGIGRVISILLRFKQKNRIFVFFFKGKSHLVALKRSGGPI